MGNLTGAEVRAMALANPLRCNKCDEMTERDYCRVCDVYFYTGHAPNCPHMQGEYSQNHNGHRTYRQAKLHES